MTPETATKLREPFPAEVIGKLPRVFCGACREATKANRRQSACQQHEVRPCQDCRNRLTTAHLHLDYVGHAETTDRLLQADPEWTWEPVAFGPDGLPLLDHNKGLWIRLTVAGVTRLGYGHAGEKTGPDAVKETIGDAIRNAAMRFGVALDLWGAKFKPPDDDAHDEQGGDRTDGWETAQPHRPKPDREQIVARGRDAIAAADNEPKLTELRGRVAEYEREGAITADDAIALRRLINRRMDELFPAGEAQAAERIVDLPVSPKQHKRMHALWREVGLGGEEHRDARLTRTSLIVGRDIDSSAQLTAIEADSVIDTLDAEVKAAKEVGG